MSNFNTNIDNDFDSFLNLDSANAYTPLSASPAIKPSLAHQSSNASSSNTFATSSQQSFAGPSYQYETYRQQTGLPTGGLANTFALNQASGLQYRPNQMGFVMPTETLNIPLNPLDDFDFARPHSYDMSDMDFEAESPSDQNLYYSGESSNAPVQRMYPGMHSQQAAQAKAAQAQRQQEMLHQQQQPKQIAGQRPLPSQPPKAQPAKDPHVEESISRLLNRMRQSSSASAEDSTPAGNSSLSGLARTKKEEEEMDEDERLLASEEGKKLSSKERRQLRNKVSARAFRSRRKEYIGQLEGEVAVKAQEANDLRVQNRQLMEENTRLTDLTRMLLSSQAFSGFLQELSNSGLPAPNIDISSSSQSTKTRKDVPAHEASRRLQSQNNQQVGMTMVPESNVSMSTFEGSNNWNTLPSNDFQVYAVTALPEPPVLDLEVLSQKKSKFSKTPVKKTLDLPTLPAPVVVEEQTVDETQVDETIAIDESFSLYQDSPSTTSTPAQTVQSLLSSLAKPEASSDTVSTRSVESESGSWDELQQMCEELDDMCQQLSKYLKES